MNIDKPAVGAILLLSCSFANGQSFEVASIRRNLRSSQDKSLDILAGGAISTTSTTLKTLIRYAYKVQSFQLAGETGWMDSEYYAIKAKTGTEETLSEERLMPYLQRLLEERFRLKVHWETREGDVYALVVDKSGLRMKENRERKEPNLSVRKNSGKVELKGVGVPMRMIAATLENQLRRPVIDKTGLAGAWDFQGAWEIEPGPESIAPSIFTGVREQLGLRVVPRKGPVNTLVIDRAERPSEN